MAERRMFSKTIIDSDAFLDMPLSTQALYFHYSMRADDDGFVNNPSKITRVINATKNDHDLLVVKGFILPFESGICVIKHWRIHNYLRNDRCKNTVYQAEKSTLMIAKNNEYVPKNTRQKQVVDTTGIPNGNQMSTVGIQKDDSWDTQCSIGKDRLGKESIGECVDARTPVAEEILEVLKQANLSIGVMQVLREFVVSVGNATESKLKALINLTASKVAEHGETAVINLINDMIASNYRVIFWDRLERVAPAGNIANSQVSDKSKNNASAYDFSAYELGGE